MRRPCRSVCGICDPPPPAPLPQSCCPTFPASTPPCLCLILGLANRAHSAASRPLLQTLFLPRCCVQTRPELKANTCLCSGEWEMQSMCERTIGRARREVGKGETEDVRGGEEGREEGREGAAGACPVLVRVTMRYRMKTNITKNIEPRPLSR